MLENHHPNLIRFTAVPEDSHDTGAFWAMASSIRGNVGKQRLFILEQVHREIVRVHDSDVVRFKRGWRVANVVRNGRLFRKPRFDDVLIFSALESKHDAGALVRVVVAPLLHV